MPLVFDAQLLEVVVPTEPLARGEELLVQCFVAPAGLGMQ